jgi:formylglycine-generating enzyme
LKYPTSTGAKDALPRSRADLIAQITLPECAGDHTWTDQPGDRESLPINCVNFYQAFLFCIWDGESLSGRLPSEAEWNAAAAGGGQQRAYPWSPRDNPGSLAIDGFAIYGKMDRYPYPVGMHTNGAGLWGTLDLGGNVYEWTRDTGMPLASDPVTGKVESPYKQTGSDPIWLENDTLFTSYRALRGGSFKHIDCGSCDPKVKLRTSSRVLLEGFSVYNDLGFRCARNY